MGFFQAIFHGKKGDLNKQLEQDVIMPTSNIQKQQQQQQQPHISPPLSSRQSHDYSRFQLFDDGTHAHHLSLPPSNRIIHGLMGIAHKSLRLTTQWADRKPTIDEIKKERAALDQCLHRQSDDRSLSDKWGICQETIGKGTSGVVKIAHKLDGSGEHLYAVKARAYILVYYLAACNPIFGCRNYVKRQTSPQRTI